MNDTLKQAAAGAALAQLPESGVVGVGSGSTVNAFIDLLAQHKARIEAVVTASKASEARVRSLGLPVVDLNAVDGVPVYFDGADAINALGYSLKGGGGALTSEKIIAEVADRFICMVDASKQVTTFRNHAVAIEVIAMARSLVGRRCVALGGNPIYREGFITDHGHSILDVYDLPCNEPHALHDQLNAIPGVVSHGLFVEQRPNVVYVAHADGVRELYPSRQ